MAGKSAIRVSARWDKVSEVSKIVCGIQECRYRAVFKSAYTVTRCRAKKSRGIICDVCILNIAIRHKGSIAVLSADGGVDQMTQSGHRGALERYFKDISSARMFTIQPYTAGCECGRRCRVGEFSLVVVTTGALF